MLSLTLLWLQPVTTTISFDIGVIVSSLAPVLAIVTTWWLKNRSDKAAAKVLLDATEVAATKVAAEVAQVKETTLSTAALVAVKVAEVKASADLVAHEVVDVKHAAEAQVTQLTGLQETAAETHKIVNSQRTEMMREIKALKQEVSRLGRPHATPTPEHDSEVTDEGGVVSVKGGQEG